ncbi:peptidoglycan-binding protein [Streptomyces agglomeratus]|uniref:peptidoglycan-binding protein n=1 Tax=Streptomyces agglomeratus TaxID=285458 RepID=UPI0008540B64|nr:peptidoglycan-binding protein [Streptomyces agglomeratus]OEJ43521.1 peptidoglycan-binding protein [Streptomyces agglomeratus]OEJ54562.1 peptidoglycan-binding protein [Streptomyces agglomeratus]
MPAAGESTTDRREKLAGHQRSIAGADDKNTLIEAIRDALNVSAPVGSPSTLDDIAKRYAKQADEARDVQDRVEQVALTGLPDAWVGSTGARAQEVVSAAARAAAQMDEAIRGARRALILLSDALTTAQSEDKGGREQLREALGMLGGEDGFFDDMVEKDAEEAERLRARNIASAGAKTMHAAAEKADDAAREAARDLNKFAAEARAGRMKTDNISAADRLVLADIGVAGKDPETNELLTANDLERSGKAMERMNAQDQAKFERMLAESKSPQERAYLVKALAAGHDMNAVSEFRDKIHGKDPAWLQRHLTPVTTAGDSMDNEGLNPDGSNKNTDQHAFKGEKWSQDAPTCVPSTVVTGRAVVDPLYALELTGGPSGQEDDPAAFRERLHDEQMRLHEDGDGANEYDFPFGSTPAGMDEEGKTTITNNEMSPHTGSEYTYQETASADARREVLTDVEKSVAEGKPVPITVEGKDKNGDYVGHSMMIVGQEGNMLQVYNPWGTTTWISEDDFINGNMQKASDNRLPNASGVHLPAE